MRNGKSYGAIIISSIYFIFGLLWIFFSDSLLEKLSPDIDFYMRIQMYKGWFYVFITTLLIYTLLRIYIDRKNRAILLLKKKDAELHKELEEKELLLAEVHHRVKNNLQMLNSLIRLRSETYSDENMSAETNRIIDQIQSMSMIYEEIYHETEPSNIRIKSYLENIASFYHSTYCRPENIKIDYQVDNLMISIKKALPLGILAGEILSNSFSHAFKEDDKGLIKISLTEKDDLISLQLEDNGRGFDVSADNNHFGLSLIKILSQQLDGNLSIESVPGTTRFSLDFR